MVTTHFRCAEALLGSQLPAEWSAHLAGLAEPGAVRQHFAQLVPGRATGKPFLMKKINGLHRYFTKCPFVENAEARELLLSALGEVIKRWESSDLSEILRYYEEPIDDGP